ncbi:DUF3012 domain-containing protein [Thioalkalivibrio sp. ALJ1]|uniref:DUF3012 domain-containing protein n=1 Tax=Thioalkalivibrio sp. ALJ1 TaxID=1158144 RepID=UPI00056F2134|nr:DUF3012 domain-containing protein [Thioalkalivibrio sp. ALJ1]
MNIPKWWALLGLMILLPLGCGSEQAADTQTDPAPVASAPAAVEANMIADRIVRNIHDQAALFEEIGDQIDAIDDQRAADALGSRLAGEYTARTIAQIEDMVIWAEAHLVPVDAADRVLLDQELDGLFAESANLEEAGMRFDRATDRAGQQLELLMMRNPQQGQAVLEGMLALGDNVEAFMQDERVLALDHLLSPETGARPVEATPAESVGSPAWCQRMANTPQAQWTMNDAFAFANHCTGG